MKQARALTARLLILLLFGWALGASASGTAVDTLSEAKSLKDTADHLYDNGQQAQAIEHYQRSLDLYQSLNMGPSQAAIRHQMGFGYLALGNTQRALEQFETNLSYHLTAGDRTSASHYYLYAAQAYYTLGEYAKTLDYLERSGEHSQPDDANRRAELTHWKVVTLEAQDRGAEAREVLAESWLSLPEQARLQHLEPDRVRLDVDMAAYAARQTRQQTWVYFAAGGALLAMVILVWQTSAIRRRLPEIGLALASVAVTLGAAELALQLTMDDDIPVRHYLHPPQQSITFLPTPEVMPGVNYAETHFTTNAAGLRGDPLPQRQDILRIVAMGGSSTEALFLDDPDTWPQSAQTTLQNRLQRPVWIGNGGKSGLNTFSHVVQAYYYTRELQPDVLVLQAGINDLNQCISGGRSAILDNARRVTSPQFPVQYRQYVFHRIAPDPGTVHSRLWDMSKRAWQQLTGEKPTAEFDFVVQDQAGLFYVDQRARRMASRKTDELPDISACLDAFSKNLETIADFAGDTPLVLLTQGSLYRHDLAPQEERLLWFGAVDVNPFSADGASTYYSAAAMAELLKLYNQRTLEFCRARGLHCLDVDAVLPKSTASYYDDVHLNVAGARRLGQEVAGLLHQVVTK